MSSELIEHQTDAMYVFRLCHSLSILIIKHFGDPLEKVAFEAIEWNLIPKDKAYNKENLQ